MKTLVGFVSAALFTLVVVGGSATAVQAGDLPDSTIKSKLMALLGGNNQAFSGVDACVNKGSVDLHGKVANEDLKTKAADLAKSIASVKEVANNIVVR
ncbi:MAG: BON domain-containing protein [Nitrospiraceae bacterium]